MQDARGVRIAEDYKCLEFPPLCCHRPPPQPSPASTSNAARSNPGIAGTIYFANENENENENEKENEKEKEKDIKADRIQVFLFLFLVLVLILSVAQCVRRAVRLPSSPFRTRI